MFYCTLRVGRGGRASGLNLVVACIALWNTVYLDRAVAALRLEEETVRIAVAARLGWVRRSRRAFEEQERQSERELVTGEGHWVDGRRLLLSVVVAEGPPATRLCGPRAMELRVRPGTDADARGRLLAEWYRRRLRARVAPLVAKWQPRVSVPVAW